VHDIIDVLKFTALVSLVVIGLI